MVRVREYWIIWLIFTSYLEKYHLHYRFKVFFIDFPNSSIGKASDISFWALWPARYLNV